MKTEICPDCGIVLPVAADQTAVHRYLGASPSCWQCFSNLLNAGEPPVAAGPLNPLLLDAYCVQHHGTPSPQAINSVAVHALVLHGVLAAGVPPENALWIRRRALREIPGRGKHERFIWLEPPAANTRLTIGSIVEAPTPAARAKALHSYVETVWQAWSAAHGETLANWYQSFVD